jgi:hypothetical protein
VWCFTSIISALERKRQEDLEFKASLSYIVGLYFKKGKEGKGKEKGREGEGEGREKELN